MKRWAVRILFCLILGAVTTVGVCWGAASVFRTPDAFEHWANERIEIADEDWSYGGSMNVSRRFALTAFRTHVPSSLPETAIRQFRDGCLTAGAPRWIVDTALHTADVRKGEQLMHQVMIEGYGWPASAMWCGWDQPSRWEENALFTGIPTTTTTVRLNNNDQRIILPTRFVFPGFLINTLFYAAIWFGLFFAAGRTRRFIRTRRGRCPRCGYDLQKRFDDGCPECGWGRGGESA